MIDPINTGKLEALAEKLERLIEQIQENQPRLASDRFFVGDSDTIAAETSLTVRFVIEKLWVVHLHKTYCDARAGLTYKWVIDGKTTKLNEAEFPWGKTIHNDIVLIVSNPTANAAEVGYYIGGWGDLR